MRVSWAGTNQWVGSRKVRKLPYKLTSGSGSFLQRILIPHWGYLKTKGEYQDAGLHL